MGGFRTDPDHPHCVHPDDVLRVDRQVLLGGPVALSGPPDRLRQHVEALQSYGCRCPAFDCSKRVSEAAMHSAFAAELDFPGYYGHNLDALNDCLGELDIPRASGVALVLWHFDRFARLFAEGAWHVLDVIADAALNTPRTLDFSTVPCRHIEPVSRTRMRRQSCPARTFTCITNGVPS